MERVKCFFEENDHFAKHTGIELLEVEPGYAKVKMEIKKFHLNGVKTVHGGAIFTLADFAFAVAGNSQGVLAVGIHATMSFLNPVSTGILFAEAKTVSLNSRIGTYAATVTDNEGNLVATFEGTAYRKKNTPKLA